MGYKYSVLTYIFGNYETPKEILEKDPECEYILVTDNKNLASSTWQIKYLDSKLSIFDKCYLIRFNLFNYISTNICIRMDGNIQIKKSLSILINKFINENYDICLMPHPLRYDFISEYQAWIQQRHYPFENAKKFFKMLTNSHYDLNYKGLFQMTFSIHKNNKVNNDINKLTYYFLKYLGSENEIERLDQTVFTYVMNTWFSDVKVLPVSEQILHDNPYMQWFWHGSNNPNNNRFYDMSLRTPDKKWMFNKEVECMYLR